MEATSYKVILYVENDICSWVIQALAPGAQHWYTYSVSCKPFKAIDYIAAIEDAGRYICDKRYRVPVYHYGVKQPIDYLFVSDFKEQLRLMSEGGERAQQTKKVSTT